MAVENHIPSPLDPTDEYIDMDISSATFLCYSINTPSHPNREFEFHMSANPHGTEPTTSPADELFYKGKLLPLHLPPRLQMVQMLLQNSNNNCEPKRVEPAEDNSITNHATPFESCNVSPPDSCQVSRELNPDEYFYEYSMDASAPGFIHPSKSWSKKFTLIKHYSLGSKLKASRTYLKSIFSKTGCSDESSAVAARSCDEYVVLKAKEYPNKYMKVAKKNPFGQIHRERDQIGASAGRSTDEATVIEDGGGRRSFSEAIKWHTRAKSSFSSSNTSSTSSLAAAASSSFSSSCSSSACDSSCTNSNSKDFHGLQLLRSSSMKSEVESSIQGAIAHCKQSQQLFQPGKSASEVGQCSLSATRISAIEKQE